MISLNLKSIDIKLNNGKAYNNINSNTIKNNKNFSQQYNIEPIDYSINKTEVDGNKPIGNELFRPTLFSLPMGIGGALVSPVQLQNTGAIRAVSFSASMVQLIVEKIKVQKYAIDFSNYAESFVGSKPNPLNAHTNWCLMFVSHCIKSNGSFESIEGFNLDEVSCSAQVRYINENNPDAFHLSPANYNNVTSSDYEPKKGDIFFIENNSKDRGTYVVQHVGIVDEVIKDENGNITSITTIEGNVDGSSYSTSVVGEKSYVVDDKGRFCLQSGNYVSDNCVIYGFFDTASSINTTD